MATTDVSSWYVIVITERTNWCSRFCAHFTSCLCFLVFLRANLALDAADMRESESIDVKKEIYFNVSTELRTFDFIQCLRVCSSLDSAINVLHRGGMRFIPKTEPSKC